MKKEKKNTDLIESRSNLIVDDLFLRNKIESIGKKISDPEAAVSFNKIYIWN
jgi:hypothetical protein